MKNMRGHLLSRRWPNDKIKTTNLRENVFHSGQLETFGAQAATNQRERAKQKNGKTIFRVTK